MSEHTTIEWTDATWNVITGCSVLSAGCKNCYAMKLAGSRLQHHPSRAGLTRMSAAGPVWTGEVRFNPEWIDQPVNWKRPRRIFVAAHSDIGHDGVRDEWLDAIFGMMAVAHWHTFQVLTKRPARLLRYLQQDRRAEWASWAVHQWGGSDPDGLHDSIAEGPRVLPHVHIGVTTEDQAAANERVPLLLQIPAAVRFISAEPLLGPVDLSSWLQCTGMPSCTWCEGQRLHWVIVGGEAGSKARPMHPAWARDLRDQCAAAVVPFLFKQWGEWTPGENVEGRSGIVQTATWFSDAWDFGREDLATTDNHADDEPDLYRIGKKAAGRLLDGCEHSAFPT